MRQQPCMTASSAREFLFPPSFLLASQFFAHISLRSFPAMAANIEAVNAVNEFQPAAVMAITDPVEMA